MIQLRKLFRRFVNRYGANYIYLFVIVMYIPILFLSTWLDGKILPVYSTFFILGALFSPVIPATYIRYYNMYRILRFKYQKKKGKNSPHQIIIIGYLRLSLTDPRSSYWWLLRRQTKIQPLYLFRNFPPLFLALTPRFYLNMRQHRWLQYAFLGHYYDVIFETLLCSRRTV